MKLILACAAAVIAFSFVDAALFNGRLLPGTLQMMQAIVVGWKYG